MKTARQIEHVKQRNKNDCAIACLSMITGKSMDEIEIDLKADGHSLPVSFQAVIRFLTRCGIYAERFDRLFENYFVENSVYLCSVVSNSNPTNAHLVVAIVMNNSVRVFDPIDDFESEKIYSIDPTINGISILGMHSLTDCSY